jgi:hypothetical protein
MYKTAKIILIRFVMTFVFALVALMLVPANDVNWAILVALAVTAVNYLLGDVLIFPSFGNIVASVTDALAAMLVAYVVGVLVLGFQTSGFSLILFGALIATGEYFLHVMLLGKTENPTQ